MLLGYHNRYRDKGVIVENITGCECQNAGYCSRHRMDKTEGLVKICQTKPEYFKLWDEKTGMLSHQLSCEYLGRRVGYLDKAKLGCGCPDNTEVFSCEQNGNLCVRRPPGWSGIETDTISIPPEWILWSEEPPKGKVSVRGCGGCSFRKEPTSVTATLTVEKLYECIHRDPRKVNNAPGCSTCGGLDSVHLCRSEKAGGLCAIAPLGKGANTARQQGYRLCSECGFREPEANLEKPVTLMQTLLEEPPSSLPENNWQSWKVTEYAFRTSFMEQCRATHVYPQRKFQGRGIIIGAGGSTYFGCAWSSVASLRASGCTLPIQFWYLGREEMDSRMIELARQIGIDCVDARAVASSLPKPPRILNGWELKPFSVEHCSFREVMYLDADCIVAKNPEYLFSTVQYREAGAIFFPDLLPGKKKDWIPEEAWKKFGLPYTKKPDIESGQFLLDKARCWPMLKVTNWLNEHSDYVYKFVYGDKSTYHIAWRGCGREFAMPERLPDWRNPSIQQYDFEGALVFQHACRGKRHLCEGQEISCLIYKDAVKQAGKDLKKKWNGRPYSRTVGISPEGTYSTETGGLVILGERGTLTNNSGFPWCYWGAHGSTLVLSGYRHIIDGPVVGMEFLEPTKDGWKSADTGLTLTRIVE